MGGRWRIVGLAVSVACLALVLLGPPAGGAPATTCPTGVQNASVNGSNGIEQSLAVDPTDTDNVIIGSIQSNALASVDVSHDCGKTWSEPNLGAGTTCNGDQSVVWDRHGNAYFSCGPTELLWSSDGGDTWSAPVLAASPATNGGDVVDRPWLTVDNTGGPRDGTLYITYESFIENPLGWVYERSSTDHGQTWSTPHRVDDPAGNTQNDPRNAPAMGADGTLYVAYDQGPNGVQGAQTTPATIIVARSKDGGVTYQRTVAATGIIRNSSPEDESELISSLAADPDRARGGHLALTWADQRSGESRILLADSVDGGVTWSRPVDIADDPLGKGNEHDHPEVTFLPDGDIVDVWRDRRCCGGQYTDRYQIFARDIQLGSGGSLTLGRTVQVTDSPQAPNASSKFNEYIAAHAGPEGLNVAWDQTVGTTPEDVYRRLPLTDFAHPAVHHRKRCRTVVRIIRHHGHRATRRRVRICR